MSAFQVELKIDSRIAYSSPSHSSPEYQYRFLKVHSAVVSATCVAIYSTYIGIYYTIYIYI